MASTTQTVKKVSLSEILQLHPTGSVFRLENWDFLAYGKQTNKISYRNYRTNQQLDEEIKKETEIIVFGPREE